MLILKQIKSFFQRVIIQSVKKCMEATEVTGTVLAGIENMKIRWPFG